MIPRATKLGDLADPTALEGALERAAGFLAAGRSPDGLWRDFRTLAGASSEWVTGFVGEALADRPELEEEVGRAARALVYRQRPPGGWGYGRSVPADADSTAWVLALLARVPQWRPSAIRRAVGYLAAHQERASGGFATYIPADGIDRYIEAPDPSWTSGWTAPHASVTGQAVAALLAHGEPATGRVVTAAAAFLRAQRQEGGLWSCYWWRGRAFPTYEALRALLVARAIGAAEAAATTGALAAAMAEGGGWSAAEGEEPGAFETAAALLALLLVPGRRELEAARRGAAWLLAHQQEDGGFPAAPILRIPPPMVTDAGGVEAWRVGELGTGVVIADDRRLFTTAAAYRALAILGGMLGGGGGAPPPGEPNGDRGRAIA